MSTVIKNVLLQGTDDQRYRVISVDTGGRRGWVYPLDDANGWPLYRDFGVLTGHANVKQIKASGAGTAPALAFYSKSSQDRARQAHEQIKPLLDNPEIFGSIKRGTLVKTRAKELQVSPTTLYRYLRLYWRNGQTMLALMPDFPKIGHALKGRTANRGRRPADDKYEVFQMTPADVDNVKKAIRAHYLNGEISTLAGAHRRMRRDSYSYLDGNGVSYLLPDGECPSIHQLRHVARTHFSLEEVKRKKHGDKKFDKEFGLHLNSALEECIGIGHIYEIDATIADVFLVALADHASIIGKPTLYLIYDRWSRMITGFYVGLESASWTGAMVAILSIATDKRALCARFNVPYREEDWLADGVYPQKFLGDLGEMVSKDSYRICDGMEITVSNTQSLHPQRKGTVECGFNLLHASIAEVVPGYEPPFTQMKRREKRYDRDASLTLDEFTTIVLKSIIAHNRGVMKGYDLNPVQVLAGTPAVPNQLWADDIVRRSGALAQYDYDYLHLQLLPQDDAIVTKDGIAFRHCFYDSEDTRVGEWLMQASVRKRFKLKCSYDRRLADSIFIYDANDSSAPIECKLVGDSEKYRGYSFDEVEYIERKRKLVNFDAKYESDNARADLEAQTIAISKSATERRRVAANGMSRSGRRADTKRAREAERAVRRAQEAGLPPFVNQAPSNVIPMPDRAAQPHPSSLTQDSAPNPERTPLTSTRDRLRRLAQEKQNGQRQN